MNINPVEQRVSTVLGGALLLHGLGRRSLSEAVLAIPLLYRGISGHSYLYQILGINTANKKKQLEVERSGNALEVERSITIEKPADTLYRLWLDPQCLSQIMQDVADVTARSKDIIHWRVRGLLDQRLEWDTQIAQDRPGEILRWKSLDEVPFPNEGSLRFRPAPRDWGTEVTLRWRFVPPGGTIGRWIANRLGFVPYVFVEKALRCFKSLAETGEIPTLKHNPAARRETHAEYNLVHK